MAAVSWASSYGTGEGQHRVALLRWGGDGAHLPDAGDGHLQGARDRRRRHGQHVDVHPQPLQLLLVLDAEALLLVDDHQTEVLELDLAASNRWVPTTTSTLPSATPSMVALVSAAVWNRLSGATLTGNPA